MSERSGWRRSQWWRRVRIVWVSTGLGLFLYLVLSFSAWGVGDEILASSAEVTVVEDDASITFTPRGDDAAAALLFLPGGMVDPHAYAPLLRRVAEGGYPAVLVKHPSLGGRHAAGEDGRREAVRRAHSVLAGDAGRSWVIAGHSLGGLLAAMTARTEPANAARTVLIGTSHPRDFSLAGHPRPILKIYGTRDRIASLAKSRANVANLPESTRWLAIEGGNHSQFGYYGFQIGDGRARISRASQQDQLLRALLDELREAGAATAVAPATDRAP